MSTVFIQLQSCYVAVGSLGLAWQPMRLYTHAADYTFMIITLYVNTIKKLQTDICDMLTRYNSLRLRLQ